MIRKLKRACLQIATGCVALLVSFTPSCAQTAGNAVLENPSQLAAPGGMSNLQTAHMDVGVAAGAAVLPDSRIGPDDLLNITVFEAPEMNTTVRVSVGGDISMQLLGEVYAAGLTPPELESVLQALLRRTYMRDPHVGVMIQELQSHAVSVVGAVKTPGVFQIRGPKSLLEILSMAQGLADDAGDTAFIVHAGAQLDTDIPSSPLMKTGIAVSTHPSHEILMHADESASVAPNRNPKVENINLKKLLESSDSSSNVLVHPGDVVKIARAGIVYVVGEVNKPGGFVLQNNESISILQALALAQGTTHTSAVGETRIIRTDLTTGKRTEVAVNLGKIFSGKRPDVMLEPKDVVFVPNSAAKSVFYRSSEMALQTAAGVAIYKW